MKYKRGLIAVSVIAIIASGTAFYQYKRGEEYRQNMENNYQRAFVELVDYAGNIDII